MNINDIIKKYHTDLDNADKAMIDRRVEEKGIEGYLTQQLVYLDCSRILQGMRMMQTIGYPYKREISSYVYALEKYLKEDEGKYDYYCVILADKHLANIEYEKEYPPVWYDGKPKKTSKRKSKAKEGDMFPEETKKAKISKAEAKLKAKLIGSSVGFGSFKIKKD